MTRARGGGGSCSRHLLFARQRQQGQGGCYCQHALRCVPVAHRHAVVELVGHKHRVRVLRVPDQVPEGAVGCDGLFDTRALGVQRRQPGSCARSYRAGGAQLQLAVGGRKAADVDAVRAQIAQQGGGAAGREARAVQVGGSLTVGVAAAAASDAQGAAAGLHGDNAAPVV